MTTLHRVQAEITGMIGGPGVWTMHCKDGPTLVPALRAFFDGIKGNIPNDVTYQIINSGDIFESTTGEVMGAWTTIPSVSVIGGSVNSHAAPAGAIVRWLTDAYLSGRRLRGRNFIVPLQTGAFDGAGGVSAATVAAFEVHSNALVAAVAAQPLVVWQRPIPEDQPGGPRGGGFGDVVSSNVSNKVAVLRSRRD